MAVLVTGGAGYIGSVAARALLAAGERVCVLDDYSTGHRPVAAVLPDAEFVEGDCGDPACLRDLLAHRSVDAVMHFAARTLVSESMERPLDYVKCNLTGTLTLLDEMMRARVPYFIFSSSAATFGVAERVPIDETHPQRPINPYGWSKRAVEELLPYLQRLGGPTYIGLRYFNAAGASSDARLGEVHDPETHLIPNLLRAALDGSSFSLFGTDYPTRDGTCERDFIHVEDLAAAHLDALRALRTSAASGFYNLGNGDTYSIREVIAIAREVTGRPIDVRERPRRPGDPPVLVASSERIRNELDWQPARQHVRTIIEDAWRFMRSHPRGYD
ncbi:MAG: UDP-glucose 4-epimerase GalE [Acidobacteriota bacterium]